MKEFKTKQERSAKTCNTIIRYNVRNQSVLVCDEVIFESNPEVKSLQSVCHKDYFERAIAVIKQKVQNTVFFYSLMMLIG